MKHENLCKLDPQTVRVVKAQITQALTRLEKAIVQAKTVERDKYRNRRQKHEEPAF